MKIQGRNCTLTVARDGDYYPLPYSEETVREASKGYVLPGVIGRRNREKTVITHKEIEGCFTTRLDVNVVQCLFLLFFYYENTFDLYADRVFEKIIYKNAKCRGFELRGENGEALKLRVDVKSSKDSYVTEWPVNIPNLTWKVIAGSSPAMTYTFDGHLVIADFVKLPLVYRFELNASFDEKNSYQIKLYFPLSTEQYPIKNSIEKLSLVLDTADGVNLDLYNLIPSDELCRINCADTVLCNQTFRIEGPVVFNLRNEKQNMQLIL